MDQAARDVLVPEARELLADMETALIALEVNGASKEIVDAVFRAAHTIKGSAGLFGLRLIVDFTQLLESVLERVRSGTLQIASAASLLLRCADYIGALIDAIEQETEDVDPDPKLREELLAGLEKLCGNAPRAALTLGPQTSAVAGEGRFHITLRPHPDAFKRGLDVVAFLEHLRSIGTVLYVHTSTLALPPASALEAETCHLRFEIGVRTTASASSLGSALAITCEEDEFRILAPDATVSDYLHVIENLPQAREQLGRLLVAAGALAEADLNRALQKQASMPPATRPRLGELLVTEQLVPAPVVAAGLRKQNHEELRRSSEARIVKVDARKLDELINMVGELVIASEGARVSATRARDAGLGEAVAKLRHLVETVRDRALSMRMTPVGDVFQRFPRVVRDLSRELGKGIALVITGAESELDKSMVDKLSDPLLHIVRNAIDHGLETPEERVASGKSAGGTLRLNAYHDGGSIVIEVSDDGRGLNRARIRAKAIERGLLTPDATPSDDEIHQLIFHAGFSTAAAVTNLSGRGVGMDVVKRSVELLRGTIAIESEEGRGTTIRIRVPLTLAIISGFQVAVSDSMFVLPLEAVVECLSMAPSRQSYGIIRLRNEPLAFVRLRDVFGISGSPPGRESLVVVQHGGQRIAVVVDQLMGDLHAVVKPLGEIFQGTIGVSSSTILGDGTVALIIDVPGLLQHVADRTTATITTTTTTPAHH